MAKIRQSNIDKSILNAQTELSAQVADDDTFLVYDTSAGALKKIQRTNIISRPAKITSVSPTSVAEGDGTGNHTFTLTGSGYVSGTTANLINESGSTVNFDSVTIDSLTQITGVIAKSSLPGSGEPYDVKVSNSDGNETITDQINVNQTPSWTTSAGSLGSFSEQSTISTITLAATDPESGSITFSVTTGSLPGGLSLNSSNGQITGTLNTNITGTTTTNFTVTASDGTNSVGRAFSITEVPSGTESFTSSGTFSVPTGITSVDVLLVAGGGGGGTSAGGGGGAGGLIYKPGFTVTPGGSIPVTVGDGGANAGPGTSGQDSVFSTLTAKGGGGGGGPRNQAGQPGGSGGGAGCGGPTGGSATQPTQSGDSGNFGFGNPGGNAGNPPNWGAGGGGGAGNAGNSGGPHNAGNGGNGKAYSISGTSVTYGGGGGAVTDHNMGPGGSGGSGGGGNRNSAGTANRGGGGGSGNGQDGNMGGGGSGGKGIVIVDY